MQVDSDETHVESWSAGVDVHQWESRQEVADIMDIISHCVKNKSNIVGVEARDILILFVVHFDNMSCHYSLLQSLIAFHAITRSDTTSYLLQTTSRRSMKGLSVKFSVTKSVKRGWNNTACDIKQIPLPLFAEFKILQLKIMLL